MVSLRWCGKNGMPIQFKESYWPPAGETIQYGVHSTEYTVPSKQQHGKRRPCWNPPSFPGALERLTVCSVLGTVYSVLKDCPRGETAMVYNAARPTVRGRGGDSASA